MKDKKLKTGEFRLYDNLLYIEGRIFVSYAYLLVGVILAVITGYFVGCL